MQKKKNHYIAIKKPSRGKIALKRKHEVRFRFLRL